MTISVPLGIAALIALSALLLRLARGASRREQAAFVVIALASLATATFNAYNAIVGDALDQPPSEHVVQVVLYTCAVVGVWFVTPPLLRQRTSERERADAEERFRRPMDGSAEPMALVGRDGRYQYVNAASLALFRYPASEVIGKHYSEFLADPTDNGANVRRAIEPTFGRASVQRRLRRGDETEMIIETEMIGLGNGNMLFVGHDITERVELATRLERERQRLRLA